MSNQTALEFDAVILMTPVRRPLGPFKPYETKKFELPADEANDPLDRELGAATTARVPKPAIRPANPAGGESVSDGTDSSYDNLSELDWPEASQLLDAASKRLSQYDRDWVVGLTRQPIHTVESPNTKRHLVTSLYAWPVVRQSKTKADGD